MTRVLTEEQKARKKAWSAAYYETNKNRIAAVQAAWRKANPEKVVQAKREWAKSNPEKIKESNKAWVKNNSEKVMAYRELIREKQSIYAAQWYLENRARLSARRSFLRKLNVEKERERNSTWVKLNPHKSSAKTAHRRAVKLQSTPKWSDAKEVSAFYYLASVKSKESGFEWHVDHVVPLISKIVCGLHCRANLQILPGPANKSKSNRHWPDMP